MHAILELSLVQCVLFSPLAAFKPMFGEKAWAPFAQRVQPHDNWHCHALCVVACSVLLCWLLAGRALPVQVPSNVLTAASNFELFTTTLHVNTTYLPQQKLTTCVDAMA
jgi:hypothetical protein